MSIGNVNGNRASLLAQSLEKFDDKKSTSSPPGLVSKNQTGSSIEDKVSLSKQKNDDEESTSKTDSKEKDDAKSDPANTNSSGSSASTPTSSSTSSQSPGSSDAESSNDGEATGTPNYSSQSVAELQAEADKGDVQAQEELQKRQASATPNLDPATQLPASLDIQA